MKRTLTFFLLLSLLVTAGWAQSDGVVQDDTQTQPTWKDKLSTNELFRHEVHFTMGDPVVAAAITDNFPDLFPHPWYEDHDPYSWFAPDDQYEGITWSSFALTVGYSYRVTKWFWVGADLSYCGFYTPVYDRPTGVIDRYDHTHLLHIMPTFRFSWVNKKIVTCYSDLGLGLRLEKHGGIYNDFFVSMLGQITLVGVRVGRQWYGSAEFGVGPMGVFRFGFGYQFNTHKNH